MPTMTLDEFADMEIAVEFNLNLEYAKIRSHVEEGHGRGKETGRRIRPRKRCVA